METIKFKSPNSEKKWIDLQHQTAELKTKKPSKTTLDKIDIAISLMSGCKVGYTLGDGRVKKVIKFLKEQTGKSRVRYGALHKDIASSTVVFKEVTVVYTEKDDIVMFKEFIDESKPPKQEKPILLTMQTEENA